MKRLTINLADGQNEELDRMSAETGVTKNGLICLAVWEWLNRNATSTGDAREQESKRQQ